MTNVPECDKIKWQAVMFRHAGFCRVMDPLPPECR